jgi:hypothetical protein
MNTWVDSTESWVSASDWGGCRGRVELDAAPALWIGIDIGVKRDSSAIVEVAGWATSCTRARR